MERLIKIQQGLRVPKNKVGDKGRFKYRYVEDILQAAKDLLQETNTAVILTDELAEVCGRPAVKATAVLYGKERDMNPIASAIGFALLDSHLTSKYYPDAQQWKEVKSMSNEQSTGSASSYARKYALCGLFAIDNGEKDPDELPSEDPKPVQKQQPQKPAQNTPKPASKPAPQPQAQKPAEAPKTAEEPQLTAEELEAYLKLCSNLDASTTFQMVAANVNDAIGKPYEQRIRDKANAICELNGWKRKNNESETK